MQLYSLVGYFSCIFGSLGYQELICERSPKTYPGNLFLGLGNGTRVVSVTFSKLKLFKYGHVLYRWIAFSFLVLKIHILLLN